MPLFHWSIVPSLWYLTSTLEKTEGAIKNGKSRKTSNIGIRDVQNKTLVDIVTSFIMVSSKCKWCLECQL